MADLVERLLQNSSPSQLSDILSDYLETAECKRDSEFYCSLKSVLLTLKEHGQLSDETIWRIHREYCLPVLRKNFTERVVLYSVYELLVLCCAIGPKDLVHETINGCIESLSNYSKDLTSPTGLPVVICLDLINCLMKKETRNVLNEESHEKLFDSLLDVLCKSDELMCARISSGIMPLFLMHDINAVSQQRQKVLWTRVKEITQKTSFSTNDTDHLQTYYATMCSLFDIFIMDCNPETSILHDPKFWELIQQGLQLQDPLSSKRAMYLLKRALDHIEKENLSFKVKDKHGEVVFYWELKKKKFLLDIWQEFVLLIETLSETQVHVVKPVLTRFSKIVAATESKNGDSQALHISWLTTIIHKASLHPNRAIRKWAVLEIMTMDLTKTTLLHPQNWDFLLGHFQSMVGEHGLYGKDHHDGIPGTLSPVGTALHSFYKNCFISLPQELHVQFMSKLVTSIEQQKFSAAPLVFVFYSLANIPSLPLLGPESLQRIRNLLLHLRTHSLNLRLATKGFILTTVANLTDPTLVSWDVFFNFITIGKLDECLHRDSWLWKLLCSWIWNTEKSSQRLLEKNLTKEYQDKELNHFLAAKIDKFLKNQEIHQDTMNDEAASLGRIIIAVADTFHSNEEKTCDKIVTLLNTIFQNFHDASTRLYMSEPRLCKAVTLLTSMLQVLCDDSVSSLRDTVKDSRDHTQDIVTNSLKHALTDILNLLQTKLTSDQNEGESTHQSSYLKLGQTLYKFLAVNSSMSSSRMQFCTFLEAVTRSNIKIIQDLQGYSNHGSQQWSTMHQSMLLIAWVCDVTGDVHMSMPNSISELLLTAIPTFKLSVEFKKPESVSRDDISFQDAAKSTASWRNSVSGYLGALWRTVAYFFQQSTTETESSTKQGVLTIKSPSNQVMEAAIEALDVASSDNVMTIMISIGLLIPTLLDQHQHLCSRALDIVWGTLRDMWEHPSFWEIYHTTMTVILSPTLLMLPKDHLMTVKIKSCIEELIAEGENRHGIMNVVVQQLSDAWTGELSSCCSPSLVVYKELVIEMLLYNASIQKSHVIDAHVDAFLRHNLTAQSPLCALIGLERRDDAQVRVMMTNILLAFDASNPSIHSVLFEITQHLLTRDKDISIANAKMYMNSRSHRKKHRAWQAVLILLPLIVEQDYQGECAEKILRYTFSSLEDSNQVSVQNFQQWTILYILNRYPDMTSLLWNELKHEADKRLGRISLLSTVAMLFVIHCVTDKTKRACLFKRAISAVFPWISTNHRQARVHAQVAVQRMWYYCVCENLELVLREREIMEPCMEFMASINDTLAEKVKLLENYFFFDFSPIRDFSMETIYLTIPKHSVISEEELVFPEDFQENPLGMRVWKALECHGIPLHNKDRRLADFVPEPYNYKKSAGVQFQFRFQGLKATTKTNTPETKTESNGISESGNVQKKIIAWKIVPPDEMMMVELQQQRMLSLQKSSGGNLIVVASLIDKAPNLGGLCRTSEIFGVQKLVLGSNEVMKDQNFKNLSVSSSKWVDVEQVRPIDLKDYLQTMKHKGFTLIGVEQTANSKPLTEYTFPHDALLLLGNEKEGIPADLIQLLDVCVEIPQVGIIRSLNVHVSGALLIWEYTRQRVLFGGNSAD